MLYTSLKHLTPELKELLKLGVVDPVWIRNIKIFERYHELRKDDVCRECCQIIVGEEFKVSTYTVKQVVLRLSK